MRETRRDTYARYGIEFDGTYVNAPMFGKIRPLLKAGNSKTGTRCYTFSLLPGGELFDMNVNGIHAVCAGTCGETCRDSETGCISCYAFYGRCAMSAARRVQFINTMLVRQHIDFVERAICAQIGADGLSMVRIHATGDFDEFHNTTGEVGPYAAMWRRVAERFPAVRFWTYTKFRKRETLFDGLSNANIVRSKLPSGVYNYGTCEEVCDRYMDLIGRGERVHVCMCGTPSELHCQDCAACSTYQYVLFLKHSTPDYEAKKDPRYAAFCEFVKTQMWDENGNRR